MPGVGRVLEVPGVLEVWEVLEVRGWQIGERHAWKEPGWY